MVNTVDILGYPHAYELTPATRRSCVLVFVHGWLLSREYWQPLIHQLSQEYQCLSYDLRGFGESRAKAPRQTLPSSSLRQVSGSNHVKPLVSHGLGNSLLVTDSTDSTGTTVSRNDLNGTPPTAMNTGFTPADYATDLVALLETLNIDQAWLIGHSLGGSIAIWASEQAPQRVKGVACVNAGGGIYLKEEFEKFRSVGQQLLRFRPPWLPYLPFIDLMMNRMNVASPVDRKWGRQRVIDLVSADADAALGSLLDSTTEEEVHKLPGVVSRLKQPVYFIGGAKDDIMEPQYVNHLASFHSLFEYTGENVIEIPDCGHLAMVECPEKVAEHLRDVLTKHGI
ncbi:MAG: alpha/beta hydrolase [Leptolyngbyaceae bacterium]|nr:alpha/beta hydrolase [Leptolyngbyaceae bacterium]